MKKIILNLLIALILIIPINVWADMAAPGFQEYEAIVVKDGGADVYEYDWTSNTTKVVGNIPKGSRVVVTYEDYLDKTWFGMVTYNDNSYRVKINDLMLADSKFDLSKADYVAKHEVYVYGDNVYLYNGPSKIYSKASENSIPVGTTLTYEIVDSNSDDAGDWLWAYTTYNGVSGWIYVFQVENSYYEGLSGIANLASIDNNKAFTIKNITTLRTLPTEDSSTVSVNIPLYTEVEFKYTSYSFRQGFGYVYIDYNGTKGWLKVSASYSKFRGDISFDALWNKEDNSILVVAQKGVELYSEILNENSKVNITVPKNSILNFNYYYSDKYAWYYVTYNGRKYWAKTEAQNDYENVVTEVAYQSYYKGVLTKEEIEFYEDAESKKVISKIPAYTELKIEYEYYADPSMLYVTYNNKKGWIINDYDKLAFENNMVYKNVFKDMTLYEERDRNSVLATIPIDTEFNVNYTYDNWYYVTYNGKKGWLEKDNSGLIYKLNAEYKVNNEVKVYTKPTLYENLTQEIGSISKDVFVVSTWNYYDGNSWRYVTYNNLSGWVIFNYDDFTFIRDLDGQDENVKDNKELEEQPFPTIEPKDEPLINNLPPNIIIAFSVLGVLCLVITALVTILLINKRKSK